MIKGINDLYKTFCKHPHISTDTRNIVTGDLFFALKGENFNANKFAGQALDSGAAFAVIDQEKFKLDDRYILVDDVLETLQELAKFHRQQLKIPFIGITGTNGKTTTKELINAVLCKKYKTHATKGNFNNHIGVPLTLLEIDADCELAIIEMGANHPGEIDDLCKIAQPESGLITNIGKAHLEGFGGFDGVVKTKKELYDYIGNKGGHLFVNETDELLCNLSVNHDRNFYNDQIQIEIMESNPCLKIRLQSGAEAVEIQTHLIGAYNLDNIRAAACIGNFFDINLNDIAEAIKEYEPTNNRSQLKSTEFNTLIMDAYNANPSSMDVAIRNFDEIPGQRKLLILGDMLELGKVAKDEHQNIIDLCNDLKLEVYFVGSQFNQVKDQNRTNFFMNTDELIQFIKNSPLKDYLILLKGSRGIRLEKVIEFL
ncbi:MAG: UDP-N-acetylmuramoyl-tripeptide--D-alanyl-D-alanine ligase [Bacteroidales bacterium]|nr:UDP-N-acetylmuramoyl-tripeptide--D-alanyl-D-alanine ligase [Bacteroidales bacterium]